MSLESRVIALAQAVGSDIKSILSSRGQKGASALVNSLVGGTSYPVAGMLSQAAFGNSSQNTAAQYLWPFVVPRKITFTALGVRVGTAGASSTILAGIYKSQVVSGVDWPESAPIASHASAMSGASTGFKSASNSQGSIDLLTDTLYWGSILIPGGTAPTLSGVMQNAQQLGFGGGSDSFVQTNIRFANASGALAAPPTSLGSYSTNISNIPALFLIP